MGQSPALICDAKGDLYIADPDNGYVRMIDTSGIIHPVAGFGQFGYINDYIPASVAVTSAYGLALDSSGSNLYISELTLSAVRVVDLTSMLIHTVAGNGNSGFLGDGGPPLLAEFPILPSA